MARSIKIHQVDVFTRTAFLGNPAGVVLDADELTEVQMATIAQEMNLSETAFVSRATSPGIVPVRFFTPALEVAVCGHATLAAHYVRARELSLASGEVTQISPGARWNVRWEPHAEATFVVMRQGPVEFGEVLAGDLRDELLAALGITGEELRQPCPIQVLSTGHAKVVIPLASPSVLQAVDPDLAALRGLSDRTGVAGYFLFALDDAKSSTLTACRMFGPAIGVGEDPVNGSGHGPLAAYLQACGEPLATAARTGFWSRMGDQLGRAGRVWVQMSADGATVEVGGYVASVFTAKVELPPV